MIRLIQRRLIIPRGDTGTFSIPALPGKKTGDVSIFTVFDPLIHRKVFEKVMQLADGNLSMNLTHGDTVNLPVGQYVWDIKFYSNPLFADEKLVSGDEVDSYYASFTLPVCEIRETGDNLLMSDDAPVATLAPDQINLIISSLREITNAKEEANTSRDESAVSAQEALDSATNAEASATSASDSADAAQGSAAEALQHKNAAEEAAAYAAERARSIIDNTPTKVSQLENDAGYLSEETDPTVPAWAKAQTKPSYTPQEVGALPDDTFIPSRTSDLVNDSNYPVDANYVHTDNNYTTAEKNKLEGIAAGAEVNVNADWNAVDGDAFILNKPTNVSEFINDIGYLIEHQDISGKLDKEIVALDYSELTFPISQYTYCFHEGQLYFSIELIQSQEEWTSSHWRDMTVGIGLQDLRLNMMALASALSAYYVKPRTGIPASDLEETYLTEHQDISMKADKSEIPTLVSQLTNDAGYLTSFTETDPTVPSWAKAAQKPTYTAAEVGAPTVQEMNTAIGNAIGNINSFDMAVVQALPTQDISTHTIYLVPKTGETNDVYDEYVYINNAWEMVGNTQIDLSNYVQKNEYATRTTTGIIKIGDGFIMGDGTQNTDTLNILRANSNRIQAGEDVYYPIVPNKQHESVFYGLAKVAGQNEANSQLPLGTYSTEAKAAIQQMLEVPSITDMIVVPGEVEGAIKTQDITINDIVYSNKAYTAGAFATGISTFASGYGAHTEGYGGTATITLTGDENSTIYSYKEDISRIKEFMPIIYNNEMRFIQSINEENKTIEFLRSFGEALNEQECILYISGSFANYSHSEGIQTIAKNGGTHAEGGYSIASGVYSHAEGEDNTASGDYGSHAEGRKNIASGTSSHAEGTQSTASGNQAHAEGYITTAGGQAAHSEGNRAQAIGNFSHAEGMRTEVTGIGSHVEGFRTIVNGTFMHGTGCYNQPQILYSQWTSNTQYQIDDKVIYNGYGYICITANSDAVWDSSHWIPILYTSDIISIVGNGYSDSNRSNAYVLDWSGNGHYMGDVYVGANADSTGGTKVLCEADFATAQDIQNIINGGAGA